MQTKQASRLGVNYVQLEVNDLLSLDRQVCADSVQKRLEMLILDFKEIFLSSETFNLVAKQLIDDGTCENRFGVRFFIRLECATSISQVNC